MYVSLLSFSLLAHGNSSLARGHETKALEVRVIGAVQQIDVYRISLVVDDSTGKFFFSVSSCQTSQTVAVSSSMFFLLLFFFSFFYVLFVYL